jgi:hypothetical protein
LANNWGSICRLRKRRHRWLLRVRHRLSIGHGRRHGSSRGVAIDRNLLLRVTVMADAGNPGEGPKDKDEDDDRNNPRGVESVALAAA